MATISDHLATQNTAPSSSAAEASKAWSPLIVSAGDIDALKDTFTPGYDSPIARVSRGEIPAVVVKGALRHDECISIIRKFASAGLYPPDFESYVAPGTLPAEPYVNTFTLAK